MIGLTPIKSKNLKPNKDKINNMFKYLLVLTFVLSVAACNQNRDADLEAAITSKLSNKFMQFNITTEKSSDTLNIIIYDTLSKFSEPYSELRSSYLVWMFYNEIKENEYVRVTQMVLKDSAYLTKYNANGFTALFSKGNVSRFKNLYDNNFEFCFCVDYIMSRVPPEVYDEVFNTHNFNQKYLEGYSFKLSFTDLLLKYTESCQNEDANNNIYLKMMRMLNWFDREDISSPRTQMFNVFFNICNYPKIDTSETPPFHPTAEYEKFLLDELDANK